MLQISFLSLKNPLVNLYQCITRRMQRLIVLGERWLSGKGLEIRTEESRVQVLEKTEVTSGLLGRLILVGTGPNDGEVKTIGRAGHMLAVVFTSPASYRWQGHLHLPLLLYCSKVITALFRE